MTDDRYDDTPARPPDTDVEDPPRQSPRSTEATHSSAQHHETPAAPRDTNVEDPPRESDLLGTPAAPRRSPLPREENDPFLQERLSGLTSPSDAEEG